MFLGPLDKVRNDQEVAGEPHPFDDAELIVQPFEIGLSLGIKLVGFGKAELKPLQRLLAQFLRFRTAFIGEVRQNRLVGFSLDGTAPGNLGCILDRFGKVCEQQLHFRRRLQILLRADAFAVRLAEILTVGDTHHGVVRLCIGWLQEAGIVRGDQWQLKIIGEVNQAFLDRAFLWCAMACDLDIAAPRIGAGQRGKFCSGIGDTALLKVFGHFALGAARQNDEAIGLLQR